MAAASSGHLTTTLPGQVTPRSLSTDTKINLIIGIFTIVTGILSTLLAWAMWRLTRDRRHQHHQGHGHQSPTIDPTGTELELLPAPRAPRPRLGYEVALRFGGTL